MAGFSLYDLVNEEYAILEEAIRLRMEAGDTQEEATSKAVATLDMMTNDKVIAYACLVKSLDATAEAIKTEESRLAQRRKQSENTAERLRARMVDLLDHSAKYEDAKAVVSFRKSVAVVVETEADKLPPEFVRIIPASLAADKTALAKALKAGTVIPGAVLEDRWNVSIK